MDDTHREELAAIKRKIRALAEKTTEQGATESEAMFAMKKVGELLLQYNLSMDEVSLREEPCVTRSLNTDQVTRNVIWHIYGGLTKFCGVKMWYSPGAHRRFFDHQTSKVVNPGISWQYYGLESDADMAVYLSDFLSKAERTAMALFQSSEHYKDFNGHRRTATANFCTGFGQRMNGRLLELAVEHETAERQAAAYHRDAMKAKMVEATEEAVVKAAEEKTGTALICVAKEKMVEENFKKYGPKLGKSTSRETGRYDFNSRKAGADAANKVNLNRPLEGTKKAAGLLG